VRELARRQQGQPGHVIAWKAQQRLGRTWRRLADERGKRRTLVAVAVARELASSTNNNARRAAGASCSAPDKRQAISAVAPGPGESAAQKDGAPEGSSQLPREVLCL
jgi:hypothetical protein